MFASMNDETYADFYNYCPCRGVVVETSSSSSSSLPRSSRPSRFGLSALLRRYLQSEEEPEPAESYETWEIVYTSLVLMWMFVALLSDKLGADSVMLIALTAFMASEIITIEEGLVGFSNEGLMSVLVLFVVAEGISKTGALDFYMSKVLGRPKTDASAQLRLMVPITILSAFLNNTPIVVVMIPIVQKWAKNINVSVKQLLIPLSFASIIGGTCTLIGTSTNLVVAGLLEERYPNDPSKVIKLFDLSIYGVPVALASIAYTLLMSPCLLPGAKKRGGSSGGKGGGGNDDIEDSPENLLLGARLTQWSPAAGRTVQRSGLRDTGGIYLVSVHRVLTGNVHRAVSNDFVLNVGDILYFTGLVESFGEFCEEHGLEVVTHEVETNSIVAAATGDTDTATTPHQQEQHFIEVDDETPVSDMAPHTADLLTPIEEGNDPVPLEIGVTKESLLEADAEERLRSIHRMTDMIRKAGSDTAAGVSPDSRATSLGVGTTRDIPVGAVVATTVGAVATAIPSPRQKQHSRGPAAQQRLALAAAAEALKARAPAKLVVTSEKDLVVVGINARDRPGLLLDISKGLVRLQLNCHHTEAAVVEDRSISVWRCSVLGTEFPDLEEIWTVLSALLSVDDAGAEAMKKRGLRVIRARVTQNSRVVGKTAAEVNFRQLYKSAIIAIQKKNAAGVNVAVCQLSNIQMDVGDVLILQVSDDSPLLTLPPQNFYTKKSSSATPASAEGGGSTSSLLNLIRKSNTSLLNASAAVEGGDYYNKPSRDEMEDGGSGVVVQTNDNEAEEDPEDNYDKDNDPAAAFRQAQLERVWKDLQVMFIRTDGRVGSGGDDDAPHSSNYQPAREFLTAMAVAPNSNIAGKTASQAGIDKLLGLFLVSIDRPEIDLTQEPQQQQPTKLKARVISMFKKHDTAAPLSPSDGQLSVDMSKQVVFNALALDEPLEEGDVLWFSGSAKAVGDLRKIPGLISNENEEVAKIDEKLHDRRLVQAVIARKGPLVGKTVKEARFRTRYGAAVIAVHREGSRVHEHPGRIKLHAGDVLLLEAGPSFIAKSGENDRSFALLSEVEDSAPPRLWLLVPALVLTVAMLAVYTAELTSLLVSALCAAILMVAIGILSEQEARDAINWDIFIAVGSAFGIGIALVNSGVAGGVAGALVALGDSLNMGDAGLIGAVYLATVLVSNVVTNNAAAALIFPIAMTAAEDAGIDIILMSYAVMLGASASFMTPFGYTTNLLIYGPGGYKTKDFLVFGTPMQLVLWVLSVACLTIRPWYVWWFVASVLLVVVAVFQVTKGFVSGFSVARKKPNQNTDQAATTTE